MLNDGPISAHLKEQKEAFGDVDSWTFVSYDLETLLHKIELKKRYGTSFTDYTGYKKVNTKIFSA